MANAVVWVDIPALDIDRALAFYSAVLGSEMQRMEYQGSVLGLFPHSEAGVGGSIFQSDKMKPSDQGPLVYINCSGRLEAAEAAIAPAGGQVLQFQALHRPPRLPCRIPGHRRQQTRAAFGLVQRLERILEVCR